MHYKRNTKKSEANIPGLIQTYDLASILVGQIVRTAHYIGLSSWLNLTAPNNQIN
jgi:hypothetical protein